jgi:hypothetical protein
MKIQETFFDRIIIPDKAIYRGEPYRMNVESKFIIKGFKVKVINDKIFQIFIRGRHPNANPKTREFCLPNILRKLPLNEESLKFIHNQLGCFNLDDCYFMPWNEIELNQMEVK